MAIGSFVRSLVDPETMGEQIIISIQDLYEKTKKHSPADDPHIILSMTYFARIRARIVNIPMARKINPNDPSTNTLILVESLLFACLPEGHNIRALALKILQDERPDIWEKYPKFESDFNMRVGILFKHVENGGSLFDLYKVRNPQLQIAAIQPFILEMLQNNIADGMLSTCEPPLHASKNETHIIKNFDPKHTAHDFQFEVSEDLETDSTKESFEPTMSDSIAMNDMCEASEEPEEPEEPEFNKAKLVIEYSSSAAQAWRRVQALPENYQSAFLSNLELSPTQDADGLAINLETQYQRELRPFDCDDANDAFEQAGTISARAQSEFREVYQILGATISVQEILSKVENRFGPSENTRHREVVRIENERAEAEKKRSEEMERYRAAISKVEEAKRAEATRMAIEADNKKALEAASRAMLFQEKRSRHQLSFLIIFLLALILFAFAYV